MHICCCGLMLSWRGKWRGREVLEKRANARIKQRKSETFALFLQCIFFLKFFLPRQSGDVFNALIVFAFMCTYLLGDQHRNLYLLHTPSPQPKYVLRPGAGRAKKDI